ncbi:MAG: endonuclease/exonuclease/phosphatase family protein [Proteiniphilum sp.]|nr:endonuclease/exonuclease/phosphatase family protein [Proteiniphilum sp.]MDD4435914.1 endonuclease/exonuclease/phosphatase family protein [Bacteroidales bacterium]
MEIKKIVLLSMILLLVSCGKETNDQTPNIIIPPARDVAYLKVMTYNIAGAASSTGVRSLPDLAEVIRKADPDLVAIQEVDAFTTRNGKEVHLARDLAALCGMEHWFFAKAMDFHGGEYGDAILSKHPFKETEAYTLSGDWEGQRIETRSAARVTVEVGGRDIDFVSTHFDHTSDEKWRILQASELVGILKERDLPVVVGGDLNCTPTSEPMKVLYQELLSPCKSNSCLGTFVGSKNAIDHLMYRSNDVLILSSYGVYSWADRESDHFPVGAVFEVEKAKNQLQ